MTIKNSGLTGESKMEPKTGFGIGAELEYVFPFNRNKWSLIFEPTYQSYKAEQTNTDDSIFSQKAFVDYSSLELPLGIRHYMFLNDRSKLFINFQYIFEFSLKNRVDFIDGLGRPGNQLEGESNQNFGFGIGYQYRNKYGVEFRSFTKRNTLSNFSYWTTDFQNLSIILSYNLL